MNSKNTVLLIIDPINSYSHKKCEISKWGISFRKIRKMMPKLVNFIDEYRKIVKGKIIFTNITPWQRKYLSQNLIELYTDPHAYYYSKDKTGFSEKFYLVHPEKEDMVITKNNYDAFTNPKLQIYLQKHKIKYIVITGIFTDGCVLATICGGFAKGYNFIILKDLIETTDVKKRQSLSKHLKEYTFPIMYGKTANSDEFLKLYQN